MLEKTWIISVFSLEYHQKTQKLDFMLYLWPVKKLKNSIFVFFFVVSTEILIPVSQNWGNLKDFGEKLKFPLKNVGLNPQKTSANPSCFRENQSCSSLFWRNWLLKQSCSALILLLWKIEFSWNSRISWISAVHRFSVNIQRWIRSETALVSADNFWITVDKRRIPLRPQPGMKRIWIFSFENYGTIEKKSDTCKIICCYM